MDFPSVQALTRLQIDTVERWHNEPISNAYSGIEKLVCEQHEQNFRLWHEEDKARNPKATDGEIARVKRAIDQLNQTRNDLIESIDDTIADCLRESGVDAQDAPLNTETAGSVIDRLSIMALRLYHYREQLRRADANEEREGVIRERMELCQQQHNDLSRSLQELLDDLFAGRKQHRAYRQMKMYNDPTLNPEIYGRAAEGGESV
ncbi:MAG: DUF4254 domain-containing protein [Planctomycetota bacterium]